MNEGLGTSEALPPASIVKDGINWDNRVTHLRSPARVTFDSEHLPEPSRIKFQEKALDRLNAFDGGHPSYVPLVRGTPRDIQPWWQDETDPSDIFWKVELGEVGVVSGSKLQNLPEDDQLLPAPYGAGYVVTNEANPLTEDQSVGTRVVFKVDSGCEPWSIVSRSFVERAGLKPYKQKTALRLANVDTIVRSDEMVRFTLRITMAGRPRLFPFCCVVWERGALHHDLLISQTVAVQTGLSIFVHDNMLREVILGKLCLLEKATHDPMENSVGVVAASIGDENEDQDLLERISPIESIRSALKPAEKTGDPWVDAELMGPVGAVFGPLPPTPADVPPMEFDVNEKVVKERTYGKTKPMKIGAASPRQADVMLAQFKELKEAGIMADAYPDYPPGPIACFAFTVTKPGVQRLPRPEGYGAIHPLSAQLAALHAQYTQSLTLERLVVNLAPINEVTVVQQYPLPSVQQNLAKLSKFKYYAKIDLTKAFWSIPLHPRCIKWTYTIAAGGLSGVWLRAPMGLAPVPGYFTYVLTGVLQEQEDFVILYADDILVGADTEEELRLRIRSVLRTLLDRGFRVSASKCQFQPQTSISYLGWTIQNGKITPAEKCLDKLFQLKKPCDIKAKDDKEKIQAVRRFLGVIQYLGHYIPCHAEELRPLYELTKTKPPTQGFGADFKPAPAKSKDTKDSPRARPFQWTQAADAAWDWGVARMREIEPLHSPTYAANTWLEIISDASKWGWGGILVEFTEGDPRPRIVTCVSGTFTKSQLNWPTITKEMFGVWATVRRSKHFVALSPFILSMDHRNLLWSAMSENEMVQRLATDLQRYRFTMRHISGPSNVLCDYLSRAQYSSQTEIERLRARARAEGTAATAPPPTEATEGWGHHSENVYCSDSDCTVAAMFGLTSASETEPSSGGEEDALEGEAAPIQLAVPPMGPHARVGEPRNRQRRRHRLPRQPEPPIGAEPEGADDELPIPHVLPHPQPLPRRLTPHQYHTIKSFHGGVLPHTGVNPLLAALREAGHDWEGIEGDVRQFVARCHYCQMERISRRGPAAFPYESVQLLPRSLMDVWHFDILGPLPPCALTGARYVLLAVEDTSKFVFVGRAMDCSVLEIMLFLLDCFKIFGLPGIIKTDRGGQYLSKAVKQFCALSGVEHVVGVAHYHQSDAVVENGAALVWPYLRIMCAELRRFHAWSPLLCNIMLGANALTRDSLGGASASEIVFNRKVRPLRFLRPEALNQDPQDPVFVNKFLADQAAMQLRLLGRADAERHRRFRLNREDAEGAMDGAEHLDWVRVGQLVAIPQPDTQHFNRPNKWAFLRRGPYEVAEVRTSTVLLIDHTAAALNRPHTPFLWPKYQLSPYYKQGDILPAVDNPEPLPEDVAQADAVLPARLPLLVSAVLSHRPADIPSIPNAPQHVRNQLYMVRWQGRRHADSSEVPYDAVWQDPAFAEYVEGSTLEGFVHPAQAMERHRAHIQHLLAGNRNPDMAMPMAEPRVQVQVLREYVPGS